jgi:Leucine-rich repeat (LRR) protein
LQGLQASLIELRLADNLLGDTLNPIFSSNEFHTLKYLQILDLGGNGIKAIEEGIFEGCESLQELYLTRNSLTAIPSASLNGPRNLRALSLRENRIRKYQVEVFTPTTDVCNFFQIPSKMGHFWPNNPWNTLI